MAKKDNELVSDVRKENKNYVLKNGTIQSDENFFKPSGEPEDAKIISETSTGNTEDQTASGTTEQPADQQVPDELQQKLDEFSKGLNFMTGAAITEIVDDLKTKFLWIHAQKQGVNIPQEALKMDAKSKEFAAFLIDYSLKNKIVEVIKKYPLIAAGGVVAISGVSSYMMIQMMSKDKKELDRLKAENEALKKRAEDAAANNFSIVNQQTT